MSSRAIASDSDLTTAFMRLLVNEAMLERRETRARFHAGGRVEFGDDESHALGLAREHLAPVIDDQRIAVGGPTARMYTPLCGRDQRTQVFDGAGAQQGLPVGLARRHREGRRDDEELRALARKRPKQLRETHVVTHGE